MERPMAMRNLKVWQKLAVMGAVLMLPFAVVTYTMVSSIDTLGSDFARQEIRGLEYYRPLLKLLQDQQEHRGMASAWLSGDASFKERLNSKGADIENDIKNVDEVDGRLNKVLRVGTKWTVLSAATRDLLAKSRVLPVDQSFELHTKAIEDTIALISEVGDQSNLTLDPDLDSYYLMNILVFQAPELSESLAQARGLDRRVDAAVEGTLTAVRAVASADLVQAQLGARRLVQDIAVALQAALVVQYSPSVVAETFLASRLGDADGRVFGTLSVGSAAAKEVVDLAFAG